MLEDVAKNNIPQVLLGYFYIAIVFIFTAELQYFINLFTNTREAYYYKTCPLLHPGVTHVRR